MKHGARFALALALMIVPIAASAQFRDLDTAMSNLERGFGSGDVDAIVAGIGAGDQVQLQFPGLSDKEGFFGRDQAAYLLDGLFNKTKASGFESVSAKGARSEGQYHIRARWTTSEGDRDLFITLQQKDGRWSIASVKSGS